MDELLKGKEENAVSEGYHLEVSIKALKYIELKSKVLEYVRKYKDDAEDVSRFMESPPGRSGRVCHFYVKEGEEERVKDWIEGKVGENGVVLSFEELCRSFNLQVKGKNREELKSRMGNLVLVLKGEAELKFQRKEKEEKEKIVEEKWRGSHGSTTLNEILVPLIAARGDVLKEVLGVRSR